MFILSLMNQNYEEIEIISIISILTCTKFFFKKYYNSKYSNKNFKATINKNIPKNLLIFFLSNL